MKGFFFSEKYDTDIGLKHGWRSRKVAETNGPCIAQSATVCNSLEEPSSSKVCQNAILVVIEGHIAIYLLESFDTLSVRHSEIVCIECLQGGRHILKIYNPFWLVLLLEKQVFKREGC
jgi:hypothetical protein